MNFFTLDLAFHDNITDESLVQLGNQSKLVHLNLWACPISDVGLAALGTLESVEYLNVLDTNVSALGLSQRKLHKLKKFLHGGKSCGDEVAEFASTCRLIEEIRFHSSQITARGIERLQLLPKLNTLNLTGTQIGDEAVGSISKIKTLLSFACNRSKFTPTGIAALQKALPNCKIEWDDPAKATKPNPVSSGTK